MNNDRGNNNNRGNGRGTWNNVRNPWRYRGRGGGGSRGNFRGRSRGGQSKNFQNDPTGNNPPFPFDRRNRRNREEGPNTSGENVLGSSGDPLPPPTKKRKTTSSIKKSIIAAWKIKLPGYCLYYPESPPQLPDIDCKMIAIADYLQREGYLDKEKLLAIEEQEYFEVSCENLLRDSLFIKEWPDFLEDLSDQPVEVVNLWGVVMHKIVCDFLKRDEDEISIRDRDTKNGRNAVSRYTGVGRIHAGVMKLEPITPLIRINSSFVGKFVTIRGAIVGSGTIRGVSIQLAFLCKTCQTEFVVDQPFGVYNPPTKCGVSEDCDNKSHFEAIETSTNSLTMDSRKIRMQDIQNLDIERGSVPKTIDCELTHGMVHKCNTGDAVTITGIVKMRKEFSFNGEQSLHNLYIEAIAMRNHKESERTMGGHWFSFSNKDYCAIRQVHDTGNLFRLMIASLCPSIFGHELVKAALILCLFGGAASNKQDLLSRRDDINVLMVGDPGIGKSQMLKVVAEVAPRSVYVCGTGSTVAGLTVTLVRDGDEYSLEAGALVMADRGVCCIDEFDKMQNQHPALLEVMEQQSVSIAKSGVFRTLPARTTVIAASNPVGGHYNRLKSINENINISSALLSRFDVVFILLDKSDEDFDKKIVEHIMGNGKSVRGKRPTNSGSSSNTSTQDSGYVDMPIPLMERLKMSCVEEEIELIPHKLMRKYIAYARQYVKPKVSSEAAAILKQYYLNLRVKHRMQDSTPITTRQLESLVRLTEARAKVELREIATAEDAKDILEIFESSLSSVFDDQIVAVSALSESILIGTPPPTTKGQVRNQAKQLVAALQRVSRQQSKNIFTVSEIKQIVKQLGLQASPDSLISILNNEAYLLQKAGWTYQLLVSDF